MCKIIQSFYSHNCNQFYKFLQNCYFVLSCLYAKQSNLDIDLYCDTNFADLLDCAPYKNVYCIFDDHNEYQKIDKLIWAWPKFIALDRVSRDTIHIDGDVFIKSDFCKEQLDFNNCDAICQHLEFNYHHQTYLTAYKNTFNAIQHLQYPDYIEKRIPEYMPNNGVLGVKNQKLWEKYRDTYWYMYNQCMAGSIENTDWCVPDIIFEQQFLKEICDKDGYTINYVLHGNTVEDINNDAIKKDYQHVCSQKKLHLQKVINLIFKKNILCYEMLKNNWQEMFPEYFK